MSNATSVRSQRAWTIGHPFRTAGDTGPTDTDDESRRVTVAATGKDRAAEMLPEVMFVADYR